MTLQKFAEEAETELSKLKEAQHKLQAKNTKRLTEQ